MDGYPIRVFVGPACLFLIIQSPISNLAIYHRKQIGSQYKVGTPLTEPATMAGLHLETENLYSHSYRETIGA
jgi:hypothetical protein